MSRLFSMEEWEKRKIKLQQQFVSLTEEDLEYTEGKEEQLVNRVQRRLGSSKQEARNIIKNA
ncbi:MAG TPA: general stress protein CsbD [Balneolaceae bacterium]|nr:general stress protein CsbD [Balneolaceae bacterium]